MYKVKEPASQVLNSSTVAMVNAGALTILEAQQEYDGGAVTPAKSIWINKAHAEKLRDFLNEQFPKKEEGGQ